MQTELLSLATVVAFLLKATGVLLLTLVAAALLRRASAGTKHTVWLTALVLVLALPLLASTLPRWRVLPFSSAMLRTAPDPGRTEAVDRPSAAGPASNVAPSSSWPGTPGVAPEAPSSNHEPASALAQAPPASPVGGGTGWFSRFDPASALVALWIAGALLILGRLAASALALRRTLSAADPLLGADWTTPLWEACDRLDFKEAPRLLRSDRLEMPFACGLTQPTIVLPMSAEEWTSSRRRAVLFHELAHIRRRDLLGHTLGRLACALYWMHPLVWTAARRLRAESERACDDLVLASGTPASEYADHLLQILVGVRGNDAPAVALPMGRRREFEGRMLAILDPALRRRGSVLAHGGILTALSLGAVALMALAPIQTGEARQAAHETRADHADTDGVNTIANIVDDGRQISILSSGAAQQDWGGDDVQFPTGQTAVGNPADHSDTVPHLSARPHMDFGLETAFSSMVEDGVEVLVSGTMDMLFGMHQQKNIPLLIRLLASDESAEVRRTAAWALSDAHDADATAALIRALRQDDDAEVREMSAWALRGVTTPAAIDAFVRSAVDDSSPEVRGRAVWALGRGGMRDNGVLEAVVTGLSDGNAEVRQRAAWAIGTIEPAAAPPALYSRLLQDEDAEVRLTAAWALGQIVDPAAQPALAAAFDRETDPEALQAITRALLQLGPLDDAALETLLTSEDPELRARAIRIAAGVNVEFWPWPWPWPEPRVVP